MIVKTIPLPIFGVIFRINSTKFLNYFFILLLKSLVLFYNKSKNLFK